MGPRLFSRGMVVIEPLGISATPASMGPRLFSRGMYQGDLADQILDRELQWGRGCSAAEWRTRPAPFFAEDQSFNGAAAVQPRNGLDNRIHTFESLLASMGPRLFSRGMAEPPAPKPPPKSSFNGAAAVQPRNGGSNLDLTNLALTLQWGRGCSAAECRSPGN